MRLQRTYTLPNCTLTIAGVGNDQEIISMLTGFELQFHQDHNSIKGGRDLLDDLIRTVNSYSLAFQKGQEQITSASEIVILEANTPDTHRLMVKQDESEPVQVILNTVQLFDLMDSLDRLCTDPITLPDLKLNLQAPINGKRLGTFSWGALLAGIALISTVGVGLYFVPAPEPEPARPTQVN